MNMARNFLSICIPTYNFAAFIGQTLDSITPNILAGVEVIILDGGSTDDTATVVAERQRQHPQIKYHRQEARGGIDRDIAKVVDLAEGEYCWLFSSDDIMKPGAVRRVLDHIKSGCDIYLCEHMKCDLEMHPISTYPIFNQIRAPEVFNLGDVAQRARYFKEARTTEAFFSFLSCPIFRKDLWEKADGIPESFYGTNWALAGRLLSLIPEGITVHYLAEALLDKRDCNDSFLEHGQVNRVRIAVEGFPHIAETIFGPNAEETFHVRRVIRNEYTIRILLSIKRAAVMNPQVENFETLKQLVAKHYLNAGMTNRCKYWFLMLTPVSLLRSLAWFKRLVTSKEAV
jgi:abequosyltransferase